MIAAFTALFIAMFYVVFPGDRDKETINIIFQIWLAVFFILFNQAGTKK